MLRWIPLILLGLGSAFASAAGLFWPGELIRTSFTSVHGIEVELYGRGLYAFMPAEVAIQGVAQDVVTLFVAVPLLFWFYFKKRTSQRANAKYAFASVVLYLVLTWLFYLNMAMFNALFLVYALNLGLSLYLFFKAVGAFDWKGGDFSTVQGSSVLRWGAWWLMGSSGLVSFAWLSMVVPPLWSGEVYPPELYHFTTLVVQGFDLAIFLPLAFLSGLWSLLNQPVGKVLLVLYLGFLPLLMLALCSKVLFMAYFGAEVFPMIVLMPTIGIGALIIRWQLSGYLK